MRTARRSTSTGCWRSASPPRRPPRAPAVTAVIAAAGSGERLGAGGPKAFVPLAGKPMVRWSVDALRGCAAVSSIVVAVPPEEEGRLGGEVGGGNAGEPQVTVVSGGATRAESVASALAAVETEVVAIHDAARPLVTPELVEALVADLRDAPEAAGVIAATPVTDTVKRAVAGSSAAFSIPEMKNAALVVEATEDRSRLWAAQTPQVFRLTELRRALATASDPDAATDEAMLVESAGGTVLIHPYGPENLKVTTPLDLEIAERLLAGRAPKA